MSISRKEPNKKKAITRLNDQAAAWRDRAQDRASLDPEVRQLMLAKAEEAERAANWLARDVKPDATAVTNLEAEASRYDGLAKSTNDRELAAYYASRATELAAEAAVARNGVAR